MARTSRISPSLMGFRDDRVREPEPPPMWALAAFGIFAFVVICLLSWKSAVVNVAWQKDLAARRAFVAPANPRCHCECSCDGAAVSR